jgi:hypothetical protein
MIYRTEIYDPAAKITPRSSKVTAKRRGFFLKKKNQDLADGTSPSSDEATWILF